MSGIFQFVDIILFAMVAAFILLRLRSVLGRRTGHEEPHSDSKKSYGVGRDTDFADLADKEQVEADKLVEDKPLKNLSAASKKAVQTIQSIETDFRLDRFLDGASKAYPMILESFWEGHLDAVTVFLSPEVAKQFQAAIDARVEEGHIIDNTLIELKSESIDKVEIHDRDARITIRFESEIISVTRDEDGVVIEGDLSDTISVIDIWTFSREVGSRDPSWILTATRAG